MTYFLLSVIVLIIGSLIIPFSNVKTKGIISSFSSAISFFLVLPVIIPILINGGKIATNINFNFPIGSVNVIIDPLSAFFIFLFSLSGVLTTIYSIEYMGHYHKNESGLSSFYFFLHLLIITMMVLVTVQNALLFLIVWELMSLSSFFLVTFENEKEDVRKAGLYYIIAMQVGAAFLIVAFAWISFEAGSLNFSDFTNIFKSNNSLTIVSFLLFFVGFGMKAGFYPFHTWLPKAHPAAPSPVSAMMSGVMIKTGIYGILRILILIDQPSLWLGIIVFFIGMSSGILGIINAVMQRDIKKLLAYSSIENIGIIGMGIGIGMIGIAHQNQLIAFLGFTGALFHIFNHFTFKSLLFYGAGAIYNKLHTRNIESLGGLVKSMPKITSLFMIATIAICGLPPLSGFAGEFILYLGMGNGLISSEINLQLISIIGMSGLAFIGIISVLGFTKIFGISFLGVPRKEFNVLPSEASNYMLVPMGLLALIIIFIGVYPSFIVSIISNISNLFLKSSPSILLAPTLAILSSFIQGIVIFILITGLLFAVRNLILRKTKVEKSKTWGCGYQVDNPRAQYTASSFSDSFYLLTKEIVHLTEKKDVPTDLFPVEAAYQSKSEDQMEYRLIHNMLKGIRKIPDYFMWIQTGNTQNYILYGVIFLILVLIWIFGV